MRCTCGQPGTITLRRRSFPYCTDCFRHAVVKRFRAEVGDGPVIVQQPRPDDELGAYYYEALRAIATEARRDVVDSEQGMRAGCTETAAAEATRFLLGERETLLRVVPASVTREELERFFKPAPKESGDAIERDLSALEEQYPGTLASVLRSAEDRVRKT